MSSPHIKGRTSWRNVVRLAWRMFVACFVIVLIMHVITALTLTMWWATGSIEVSRPTAEQSFHEGNE